MFIYTVVVIAIVLMSSMALIIILKKNNMLGLRTMLAIIFSSITTIALCLIFPFFIGSLANYKFNKSSAPSNIGIIWSGAITFVVFVTLIFVMTIFISTLISDKKERKISERLKNNFVKENLVNVYRIACNAVSGLWNKILSLVPGRNKQVDSYASNVQGFEGHGDESIAEPIYTPDMVSEEELILGKNILEKSVDSEQNTDKMGVETVNDGESFPEEKYSSDTIENEQIEYPDLVIPENVKTENDITEKYEPVNEDFEISIDYFEQGETKRFAHADGEIGQHVQEIGMVEEDQDLVTEEDLPVLDIEDTLSEITVEEETLTNEEIVGEDEVTEVVEIDMQGFIKENAGQSIDEYVNEAFRLKESGDLEGAIIYYMYALDKKPDNDLVFWIILDTCVLYKELGQTQLAKEILESYVAGYGNLMDESIMAEIEKNLL